MSQLQGISDVTVSAAPHDLRRHERLLVDLPQRADLPVQQPLRPGGVAHAINYTQIIQQAFGGYATQWVGPVPPGTRTTIPGTLAPYQLTTSRSRSRRSRTPPARTTRASRSRSTTCTSSPGTDWSDTASAPRLRPGGDRHHDQPGRSQPRPAVPGAGVDPAASATRTRRERRTVLHGPGVLHLRLHLAGRLDAERRVQPGERQRLHVAVRQLDGRRAGLHRRGRVQQRRPHRRLLER